MSPDTTVSLGYLSGTSVTTLLVKTTTNKRLTSIAELFLSNFDVDDIRNSNYVFLLLIVW